MSQNIIAQIAIIANLFTHHTCIHLQYITKFGLCIKVGWGHCNACVGTWDLQKRGEGLGDFKYGMRGCQIQGCVECGDGNDYCKSQR